LDLKSAIFNLSLTDFVGVLVGKWNFFCVEADIFTWTLGKVKCSVVFDADLEFFLVDVQFTAKRLLLFLLLLLQQYKPVVRDLNFFCRCVEQRSHAKMSPTEISDELIILNTN